jgi:predicted MPP superfamily phosphohydrolase
MNTNDLVLNIAVNLNRISKFLEQGNKKRAKFFIEDNNYYLKEIESKKLSVKFKKTFDLFKKEMVNFKDAEDFLTWANILQHRAKLA